MEDQNLISTGELARRVGLSPSGIRKLASLGLLPPAAVIAGTHHWAWRVDDLPAIEAAVRQRRAAQRRRPTGVAA
jgi:hypothetical protein